MENLKTQARWVAWRLEERQGRKTKVPVCVTTGENASSTDPATWSTYAEAAEYVSSHDDVDGVGVVFGDGLAGVDLDHVRDKKTGELTAEAQTIVEALSDAYCEISPSGTGLHFIMQVDPSYSHSRKKGYLGEGIGENDADIEIYTSGRYFTVTEDTLNDVPIDGDLTIQLSNVANRFLPPKEKKAKQSNQKTKNTSESTVYQQQDDDNELLQKMFRSRNGAAIKDLHCGNTDNHNGDHSAADLAYCSHLAYWTNGSVEQMDRIFRQSGLMRGKWDVIHDPDGNRTYGRMTIDKALEDFEAYVPTEDRPAMTKPDNVLPLRSQLEYLDNFFDADCERLKIAAKRKTGFKNWDDMQPFIPGLYIIGAIPSLGKTAFCLQLASQLAKGGETCIYFALEQTEEELIGRNVSREAFFVAKEKKLQGDSPIAMQIRLREWSIPEQATIYAEAREAYRKYCDRLLIPPANFSATWKQIDATVRHYIDTTGIIPTVFVDYIQLLKGNERQTERQIMDESVQALKALQMETGSTVVAVSSVNRANYIVPISFEAFKESGGLEFTADVLEGMDLSVIHSEEYRNTDDRNVAKKRDMLDAAKRERPRRVTINLLKNRFNELGTLEFEYYSASDVFIPVVTNKPKDIDIGFEEEESIAERRNKRGI